MSRVIAILAAVTILCAVTVAAPAEAPKVNLNISGHVVTPSDQSAEALKDAVTALSKKLDAKYKCLKALEVSYQSTATSTDLRIIIKVEGVALPEVLDFSASVITESAGAGKVNLTSSVASPTR